MVVFSHGEIMFWGRYKVLNGCTIMSFYFKQQLWVLGFNVVKVSGILKHDTMVIYVRWGFKKKNFP